MRFAIFTHVEHFKLEGRYYTYAPYIREMNIWLKHVEKVEVIAPAPYPAPQPLPRRKAGPKGELINKDAYLHPQLIFTKIPSFDLLNLMGVLKTSLRIPSIMIGIISAMQRADHLHLRCPGNVGLMACLCQIFFPGKPKTAKYAGNWDPDAKQPWSYKFQKWILSNTLLTRNMQVLVYGDWPEQSKNIVPFFTASFSESEKGKIGKDFSLSFKFLFVGNLVPGKQPALAIQIVSALNKRNIPAELHIYGDGELIASLKDQVKNKTYIHLNGNQPLEVLKQAYKNSHFLILASKSEGWPKAVAEAMFFGCIPIATEISCVPWMLNYGSRGILIPGIEQIIDKGGKSGYQRVVRGQRTEDSHDGLGKVVGGLLNTFQKRRQFECFPDSPEGERGNLSRTGFSETLEVTESGNVIDDTVVKIIQLINKPEEMKKMSKEAQEWSQEYTLERFEEAIKKVLKV